MVFKYESPKSAYILSFKCDKEFWVHYNHACSVEFIVGLDSSVLYSFICYEVAITQYGSTGYIGMALVVQH